MVIWNDAFLSECLIEWSNEEGGVRDELDEYMREKDCRWDCGHNGSHLSSSAGH